MTTEDRGAGTRYAIRAVSRVCDILDAVRQQGGATLSEIAATTSLPKSSAFRYLTALEERNYVQRDAQSSRYQIGLAFQPRDLILIEQLKNAAGPHLITLRDRVGETANLGVLDNGQVTHLLVEESRQPMRLAAHVGDRGLIHSTALGKAMAAQLSAELVAGILRAYGMPAYTPATIVEEDVYRAHLDAVRRLGYAVDDSENQNGGRCIAVAVPGVGVPAGLSISAPATQLPESRIPPVVQELQLAAAEIAVHLGQMTRQP